MSLTLQRNLYTSSCWDFKDSSDESSRDSYTDSKYSPQNSNRYSNRSAPNRRAQRKGAVGIWVHHLGPSSLEGLFDFLEMCRIIA